MTPPKQKKDDKKDSPINSVCPFSARKARKKRNQDVMGKTSWKVKEMQEVMVQKQALLVFRHLQGTEKGNLQSCYKRIPTVRKQWRGRQKKLNSWRKSIRKTWLAAGQRMLGSDWRGSPEWLDPGVGSTDHPSLLSIKYMRDWKQKLHSYCLDKESLDSAVLVLDEHSLA